MFSSVREIPGSIPALYEFSVWKESGAPVITTRTVFSL